MSVFGQLLSIIRKEHRFTQETFILKIATLSKEFESLNAVTLSRWETGKTSTSYKKKRELFKIFVSQGWLKEGSCRDFVRNRFENLYEPLEDIFNHNYQTLIANVPKLRVSLSEYNLHTLQHVHNISFFEHIVDIEVAGYPEGYYTVSPDALQTLCHDPGSFSLACERKNQHLGHFIMFKLHNSVAQQLVHNQINENHLNRDDLCDRSEAGSYYIHALYGVNPTIAALLNTKAYLYFFDNFESIDNISIFSCRTDGMRLARSYGIQVVAQGKNREHGFTWYGMESPVEDILFSDTVLKLIF